MPIVSVIIPNYNHATYLEQRIKSVLKQTLQDFEVILMDDCSTDMSVEILKKYAQHPKVSKLLLNEQNSGSTFVQWKKGIEQAKGEYIWIAESDDVADVHFLETLLPVIDKDESIALAYAQSYDIDENDNTLNTRLYWTENFSPNIWQQDFVMQGNHFIENYMIEKNVVPNASAVLFRKDRFLKAYDPFSTKMKMAGDWLLWISLVVNQKVAFVATPLNKFRLHSHTSRTHDTFEKRRVRVLEQTKIVDKISSLPGIEEHKISLLKQKLLYKWIKYFSWPKGAVQRDFYRLSDYSNIPPIPLLYKTIILKLKANFFNKAKASITEDNISTNDKPCIAIISPEKSAYSATFIQAHIELLDVNVKHLHGVFFPIESSDQKYILKEPLFLKKLLLKLRLKKFYKGLFKDLPLAGYLQDSKVQLIMAEFGPVGAEIHSVCQLLEIPLIIHFHGFDAYAYRITERYENAYWAMFKYATYIIVVSEDMKRQLIKLGAPENKLILNPYGPNPAFLDINPTFSTINFVAVGRFVDKKAPHLTIKAFKKVHEQIPKAKLTMAGDGPMLEDCQKLVSQLKLQEVVTFIGPSSPQKIMNLFTEAYCFVQHSVRAENGDSEGTPVAILEASAAGLPIVSTKHAGIQDVVLQGKTGFLADELDVDSMGNYMLQLAQDKNLAIAMGMEGRKRIRENYTMDKHIDTINHLIIKALNI